MSKTSQFEEGKEWSRAALHTEGVWGDKELRSVEPASHIRSFVEDVEPFSFGEMCPQAADMNPDKHHSLYSICRVPVAVVHRSHLSPSLKGYF